jgi:group I intron endonuclease
MRGGFLGVLSFFNIMIGIYKITSPSSKVYIGQSVNIERRFLDYKKSLKKQQIKHFKSIKKYGYENHIFEVIEECSIEFLNERERYWQEYYDCVENGLNCRYTKTHERSGKFSKDTIKKMKNKNIDYLKGNSFRTGIKHTEEIKQQIRNTLIENSK